MQFNITFKTIFEYVLKKLVLCIQIRFVSTEKTTRIASRASCYVYCYDYEHHYSNIHIVNGRWVRAIIHFSHEQPNSILN